VDLLGNPVVPVHSPFDVSIPAFFFTVMGARGGKPAVA